MNKKTEREINEIKEKIIPFLKKYNISHAGIFGSIVRGELKKDSDVDILVEIPRNIELDLLDFAHIKNEIQEAIDRNVDLIEYSTIRPALKKKILKEEVSLL